MRLDEAIDQSSSSWASAMMTLINDEQTVINARRTEAGDYEVELWTQMEDGMQSWLKTLPTVDEALEAIEGLVAHTHRASLAIAWGPGRFVPRPIDS